MSGICSAHVHDDPECYLGLCNGARKMTLVEKRIRFLRMIGELLVFAAKEEIQLICFTFWRSNEDQAKMISEGKSKIKRSKHQDWLAMDFCVMKEMDDGGMVPVWSNCPEYELLGGQWEFLGGTWGGRWETLHDIYHFEL